MSELMTYHTETSTVFSPAEMAAGISEHIYEFGAGHAAPQPSFFVLEHPLHREVWGELTVMFGLSTDLSKAQQVVLLSDDGQRQLLQRVEGDYANPHGVWIICQETGEET